MTSGASTSRTRRCRRPGRSSGASDRGPSSCLTRGACREPDWVAVPDSRSRVMRPARPGRPGSDLRDRGLWRSGPDRPVVLLAEGARRHVRFLALRVPGSDAHDDRYELPLCRGPAGRHRPHRGLQHVVHLRSAAAHRAAGHRNASGTDPSASGHADHEPDCFTDRWADCRAHPIADSDHGKGGHGRRDRGRRAAGPVKAERQRRLRQA